MRSVTTRSVAETEALGGELARELGSGVVLLEGELGTGKTVLVRGMAAALGVDRREVQSPTYTLIHEYEGRAGTLVHVDLYRLEPHELETLGLDEHLAGPDLVAIEWPDRLGERADLAAAVRVTLRRTGRDQREITIGAN